MAFGRLRLVVVFGVALVICTETLGAVSMLRPGVVRVAWLAALLVLARPMSREISSLWRLLPTPLSRFERLCAAGVLAVAAVTGLTAWLSPPNSADAMAYHLPRVIYWAQQASVSFFPTPYFNQVALAPFAEYLMLHEYLLLGGSDGLANFGQWAGMLGSVAAVWALAGELGFDREGRALAALAAATLPNGILQASGAKNDWLCAMWLVTAACLARRGDSWFAGLALGLAAFTKATAFLFAWPVLLLLWRGERRRRVPAMAAAVAVGVLTVNGPQFARNVRRFGSPLGPASARADEDFRWSNDRFGWRETASNLLRHVSEQLGARSPAWNKGVFDVVVAAHALAIGIDPQDPATTWRYAKYAPPRNANHEADGPNRWHLLLIALGALASLSMISTPSRPKLSALIGGLALAALSFCFYLKWQPFMARLWLPWFVMASPLVAVFWRQQARWWWLRWVLCVFLLNNARPALFENWTRPLKGPQSLLRLSDRTTAYFNDMSQWNNRASYLEAAAMVSTSGCGRIGVDIRANHLEYPLLALIRQAVPEARFEHTTGEAAAGLCAVVCLDCTPEYEAGYPRFSEARHAGRFAVFTSGAK